ncbi:transketolase [Alphaproteobacteria bacterium]|nr:transketolase [Alphaproteobacteria bacterium]
MINQNKVNLSKKLLLDKRSIELRNLVIRALDGGKRGHLGSAFSLIEILRVLYDNILKINPIFPNDINRDRCILSKGHGCLALYAILSDKGFFSKSELDKFCHFDGILGGHPEAKKIPGVEASTGALGHGLSIGIGQALSAKMQKRNSKVFVIMGDGEINEGSVWEAAMCAGKHKLSSLTAIIDYNKIQSYGKTSLVQDLEPLTDKWESFGFSVKEVNGHDVNNIKNTLFKLPFNKEKPSVIISHSVKGRGIKDAEGNPYWHHKSKISNKEIADMYNQLGVNNA